MYSKFWEKNMLVHKSNSSWTFILCFVSFLVNRLHSKHECIEREPVRIERSGNILIPRVRIRISWFQKFWWTLILDLSLCINVTTWLWVNPELVNIYTSSKLTTNYNVLWMTSQEPKVKMSSLFLGVSGGEKDSGTSGITMVTWCNGSVRKTELFMSTHLWCKTQKRK